MVQWRESTQSTYPAANRRAIDLPDKPAGLTATPGNNQVTLTWTNPNNADITRYQVRYKLSASSTYDAWANVPGSGATTHTHTLTGLTNGNAYNVQIRSVTGAGPSPASDAATVSLDRLPAKPSTPTAVIGSGTTTLTWTNPNNSEIDGYQYRYKESAAVSYGAWQDMAASGANTTSYTITGLDNGKSYDIQIRAVTSAGEGPESDAVAVQLHSLPAKPTGLSASRKAAGEVKLSWTIPNNTQITRYQYRKKLKSASDYDEWENMAGSGASTVTHDVSGLTDAQTYQFQIRAATIAGEGPTSDTAEVSLVVSTTKPTGLSATAGNAQVTLNWTAPADSTGITKYQYQYKLSASSTWGGWQDMTGSNENTVSYTVSGLDNGKTYNFKIRAFTNTGGPASDPTTVALESKPSKPSGFAATAGNAQATLSWTNPNNNEIDKYQYQYKVSTSSTWGGWTDVSNSGASTVSFTLTGLDNGKSYNFRIRAYTLAGEGPQSDAVTVALPLLTAKPDKPGLLVGTAGDGSVTLTWTQTNSHIVNHFIYQVNTNATQSGNFTGWGYFDSNATNGVNSVGSPKGTIPGSDGSTRSHTFTGLTNGRTYRFKIWAVNTTPDPDKISPVEPNAPPWHVTVIPAQSGQSVAVAQAAVGAQAQSGGAAAQSGQGVAIAQAAVGAQAQSGGAAAQSGARGAGVHRPQALGHHHRTYPGQDLPFPRLRHQGRLRRRRGVGRCHDHPEREDSAIDQRHHGRGGRDHHLHRAPQREPDAERDGHHHPQERQPRHAARHIAHHTRLYTGERAHAADRVPERGAGQRREPRVGHLPSHGQQYRRPLRRHYRRACRHRRGQQPQAYQRRLQGHCPGQRIHGVLDYHTLLVFQFLRRGHSAGHLPEHRHKDAAARVRRRAQD